VLLQEAAVLESCLQLLIERCGLMPGQLGVITPYAAQVALLSKQLQARGFSINGSGRSSAGWDSEDGKQRLFFFGVGIGLVYWWMTSALLLVSCHK
jgi:hypothetical protein